jgi:hypothetical protein
MEITMKIVGLWSIDALFAPGAQEDTLIAFRENGTGWMAYLNALACDVNSFVWKGEEGDRISISGTVFKSPEETRRSDLSFSNLGVRFYKQRTPVNGEITVIEFDQDMWLGERRFGLITRDATKLEEPV